MTPEPATHPGGYAVQIRIRLGRNRALAEARTATLLALIEQQISGGDRFRSDMEIVESEIYTY